MAVEWTELNDWGIPHWRMTSNYGDTEQWDESRWRWEFLRRRTDYREDFNQAWKDTLDDFSYASDDDYESVDPSILALRAYPISHPTARKYGLRGLFDPVVSDWQKFGPEWNAGLQEGGFQFQVAHDEDGQTEVIEAPHFGVYTFDLRRPLAAQLDDVREILRQRQWEYFVYGEGRAISGLTDDDPEAEVVVDRITATPKYHKDKWLLYLRCLDAREAGASLNEIAKILPASNSRRDAKAAHNVIQQAHSLSIRFLPLEFSAMDPRAG